MSWYFDPNRVTQAAAYLMQCSGSSRMQYLKMLKLLYFADRESIRERGFPITGDDAYAMDYGPVLTHVYDYIREKARDGAHIWSKSFRRDGYDLVQIGNPGTGYLSRYYRRILDTVYADHKDLDGFDMSQLSHDFPEWKTAYGNSASTRIPIEEIVNALGLDIPNLQAQIEEERTYFRDFGNLHNELHSQCG